jgi:putative CocE/NonD family hydrolase
MRLCPRLHQSALAFALALALGVSPAAAQRPTGLTPDQRAQRERTEQELESLAIVQRKVMVPMRDGARMAADVYVPRDAPRAPAIFVRTPYNFNYWDVRNGAPRDMHTELDAVKRGYAYVEMNERGHFFSEGNYEILGAPRTDGEDAIAWIAGQSWSNGKVGLLGCSSTAEWQMGVAAMEPKGLAAINPQGFGAGVGRVAPYFEQGNWYRGGAVQMLFIPWIYGEQNQVRPTFPRGTSQEELVRASRLFDLAEQSPPVDWAQALRHLPLKDILQAVGGPKGMFADSMPIPTGGAMVERAPDDSAWYRGGLFHDDMKIDAPGLWFMSWYDVSVGPNLATYQFVRRTASPEVSREQWAIIAPTLHCSYTRATENTVVGERSVGDARFDYQDLTFGFFDRFLKGAPSAVLDTTPRVRYYTMGVNRWQSSDSWPPAGARPLTYFLSSAGKANSLAGDGILSATSPSPDHPDAFSYDPMNPVPSLGGNVCCTGNAIVAGSMDQQKQEARPDILVYSTPPLKDAVEVTGPVTTTLYVSSDAKDTDFTVKLIDVYPDGRAYNLDETIQRVRYREGYRKPVFMESGKVYRVVLGPMNTSNVFDAGHRIRIEVSSSNFPRFDRNLNTGGRNWDEAAGVVAHNVVHHSKKYPSQVVLTVVPRK